MGLNSPDVRTALHWGPSADIESYVQESGRIGRDGQRALAKLLYTPRDLASKFVSDSMKAYCTNPENRGQGSCCSSNLTITTSVMVCFMTVVMCVLLSVYVQDVILINNN